MSYCRGGKNSKRFSRVSNLMDQILQLSGVDLVGAMRQSVVLKICLFNRSLKNFSFVLFMSYRIYSLSFVDEKIYGLLVLLSCFSYRA